jgi:hypothetical protein
VPAPTPLTRATTPTLAKPSLPTARPQPVVRVAAAHAVRHAPHAVASHENRPLPAMASENRLAAAPIPTPPVARALPVKLASSASSASSSRDEIPDPASINTVEPAASPASIHFAGETTDTRW